jgi:hypothetical protein
MRARTGLILSGRSGISAVDPTLRQVARALTHLLDWVDHHSGGGAPPARTGARLTIYHHDRVE